MGRLTTTYPDNTTDGATFDAENDRLTSTDRASHTTTYTYDGDNRLNKTTYADKSFAQTNYDTAGCVSSTVDANGNTTTYGYDHAQCSGFSTDEMHVIRQKAVATVGLLTLRSGRSSFKSLFGNILRGHPRGAAR